MILNSAESTKQFAKELLTKLGNKNIIALEGSLGSGKTTFVQGLAEGLGIKKRVLSPTFVFLRSYKLENQPFSVFHHFDLYRCETLEDVKSTGLEEVLLDKDCLIAIEWPEIAKEILPENTVWLKFKKIAENSREIEVA